MHYTFWISKLIIYEITFILMKINKWLFDALENRKLPQKDGILNLISLIR